MIVVMIMTMTTSELLPKCGYCSCLTSWHRPGARIVPPEHQCFSILDRHETHPMSNHGRSSSSYPQLCQKIGFVLP